jgi:hypothetical protein
MTSSNAEMALLGRVRRLDRLHAVCTRNGDPDCWALYERMRARLDADLGNAPKPLATLIPFPKREEAAS